ncbi:MAG: ligase [Lautropia sp.]|nr:ligase [Lautropia sp.]
MQKMNEDAALDGIDGAIEQRWNERALLERVSAPHWHAWTYRQPAVILGRSQHRLVLPEGSGLLPLVKRGAGGGAVLVGPWLLSASLVLPPDDPRVLSVSITDSYRWLGEAMVATLAELGVVAHAVAPEARVPAPADLSWACFAGVAPWEVVVDDPASGRPRKLIGFAQRRSRHGVLLAWGMLLSTSPWAMLAERLGVPMTGADELAAATVGLDTLLPAPIGADDFLSRLTPHLQPMLRVG